MRDLRNYNIQNLTIPSFTVVPDPEATPTPKAIGIPLLLAEDGRSAKPKSSSKSSFSSLLALLKYENIGQYIYINHYINNKK